MSGETPPETPVHRWLRERSDVCTDDAPSYAPLGRGSDHRPARRLSGENEYLSTAASVPVLAAVSAQAHAFCLLNSQTSDQDNNCSEVSYDEAPQFAGFCAGRLHGSASVEYPAARCFENDLWPT